MTAVWSITRIAGQYVSSRYSERLAEAGVEPSVGSKGGRYDNALAETINMPCKAEKIHRRAPWETKEAVELATLERVDWFNNHRHLQPVGYIPPAEAEENTTRMGAAAAVESDQRRRVGGARNEAQGQCHDEFAQLRLQCSRRCFRDLRNADTTV